MMHMTIPRLLDRASFKYPHKEAIVSEAGRWTYSDLETNANKRAQALKKQGVKKGDHVATLFNNGNEIFETFLALMKLGAVIVPLNVRLATKELHYILDFSDTDAVIYSNEFKTIMSGLKPQLPKVKKYFECGGDSDETNYNLDRLTLDEPDLPPDIDIMESDIAIMLFTAGTTGRPKGVLLSHANIMWSAVNIGCDVEIEETYRILLVFPLYHIAAFMILMSNLFVGCTTVTLKHFDAKRVMELIGSEKINRMSFPPTVWNFILQLPDLKTYDTGSVRAISSGSAILPLETKQALIKLFPNAKIGETYGMSESSGTTTYLNNKYSLQKLSSVGKPYTNVEVRVVDDDGLDVGIGTAGEIICRGPNIMTGYYKQPRETSRTIKNGWLYTGDMGRWDEDGFLYIVDRKKDMIISGGENIFPAEIEDVLYHHPKILEASVIGLPDSQWGERVHAIVALKPGEKMTPEEVINYCKSHIASFKKPKSIAFVDQLPRSPVGKVLKRELRLQYS